MKVKTNLIKFENELQDVANLFYEKDDDKVIDCLFNEEDKTLCVNEAKFLVDFDISQVKHFKRFCKNSLYLYLAKKTKRKLPWGSLTGVRPTMLAYQMIDSGESLVKIPGLLKKNFFVTKKKAKIVKDVIISQNKIQKNSDNDVDFYIHIPVCPSKCYYCSFPSSELRYVKNFMPKYVESLKKEIVHMLDFLVKCNKRIRCLYFGGGTPTVLEAHQLDEILSLFDELGIGEKTVECGRPDTITKEKLLVLKKHNVGRICVNPQTFCDETLKVIGRNHTADDVLQKYYLAKSLGFYVNMDLICGLDGETLQTFKKSLKKAIYLNPENITVHTLAIKRGSAVALTKNKLLLNGEVEKMLTYAYRTLKRKLYNPYYLYRQKAMVSALENVGFGKEHCYCKFNVDSMEESSSIVACGAGAVTKVIFEGNRIERQANVKGIKEYIERLDEMIADKQKLLSKQI